MAVVTGYVPGLLPEVARQSAPEGLSADLSAVVSGSADWRTVPAVSLELEGREEWRRVFPSCSPGGGVDVYAGEFSARSARARFAADGLVSSFRSMAVGVGLDPDGMGLWFADPPGVDDLMDRLMALPDDGGGV